MASVYDRWKKAQEESRKANEDRYNLALANVRQSLSLLRSRYGEASKLLDTLGQREIRRAGKQTAQAKGQDLQGLISSGRANSTVLEGLRRQRDRDYNEFVLDVQEGVARQRSGLLTEMGQMEATALDRLNQVIIGRTDTGPDPALMSELMGQSAAGGGGYSFTGGKPGGPPSYGQASGGAGGGGSGGGGGEGGGGGQFSGAWSGGSGTTYGAGRDVGGQKVGAMPSGGGGLSYEALRANALKGGQAYLGTGAVGPSGRPAGSMDYVAAGNKGQLPGSQAATQPGGRSMTLADRLWANTRLRREEHV